MLPRKRWYNTFLNVLCYAGLTVLRGCSLHNIQRPSVCWLLLDIYQTQVRIQNTIGSCPTGLKRLPFIVWETQLGSTGSFPQAKLARPGSRLLHPWSLMSSILNVGAPTVAVLSYAWRLTSAQMQSAPKLLLTLASLIGPICPKPPIAATPRVPTRMLVTSPELSFR